MTNLMSSFMLYAILAFIPECTSLDAPTEALLLYFSMTVFTRSITLSSLLDHTLKGKSGPPVALASLTTRDVIGTE